jgi:hypothetical protein
MMTTTTIRIMGHECTWAAVWGGGQWEEEGKGKETEG